MPIADINPRTIRGSLLNLWRSRLRGRRPSLLGVDIWRALRPCYEATLDGQLSGHPGHILVEAHCQAYGLSKQDARLLHSLRQHLNKLSHTQDELALDVLSSLQVDQWWLLLTSLLNLLGTPFREDDMPEVTSWIEYLKQFELQDGTTCQQVNFDFPVCTRRNDENLARLDALRALRPLLESMVDKAVSSADVWQDYASSRRAPEIASLTSKLNKLEKEYCKRHNHFREVWRYLSHHAVHKRDQDAVPIRTLSWENSFLRVYELALLLASQEPNIQLKNFLRDLRDRSFLNSQPLIVTSRQPSRKEAEAADRLSGLASDNATESTIGHTPTAELQEKEQKQQADSPLDVSISDSEPKDGDAQNLDALPSFSTLLLDNIDEVPTDSLPTPDHEEHGNEQAEVELVLKGAVDVRIANGVSAIIWDLTIRHLELSLVEDSINCENLMELVGEDATMQLCRVRIPHDLYQAQMPCPLSRGDVLSIHHLRGATEHPNEALGNAQTMLVLAPDLMFGPRDIAESFDKPGWRFFADKLKASESHKSAMRSGSALNDIIDHSIKSDVEYDQIVEEVVTLPKYQDLACELRSKFGHPRVRTNVNALTKARRGKKTQIEATWFSPRLGIEGRTDLIDEDGTIIEIKLNQDPLDRYPDDRYGTGTKQRLQLACYGMVMEDVTGSMPPMKMFFAMSEDPERDLHLTQVERNTILKSRNQLAYQMIASDQYLGTSLEAARKETPDKFDDHLRWLQSKTPNSFNDSLWAIMSAHTLREAMAQWLGHGTSLGASTRLSLWRHAVEYKRQSGNLLDGLLLLQVDEKRLEATFTLPDGEALADNFREGDMCTLVPAAIPHAMVWHRPLLRGQIVQRSHDQIRLSFLNPISSAFELQIGDEYRIEPSQASSHVWQAVGTHRFLLSCPRDYLAVLCGFKSSETRTDYVPFKQSWLFDIDGRPLADDQVDALERATAAKHLHLIQGPPGSGKTSTILTRLVGQEIVHGGWLHPCFVLTLSNRAADEAHTQVDKFFKNEGVNAKVHRLSSRDRVSCIVELHKGGSHVIISTVSSFASIADEIQATLNASPYEPFNATLFVDEASQLKDSDILGNMARFARVILIGDHCQLPPIVALHSDMIADASRDMREKLTRSLRQISELSFQSLGESTFARLARVNSTQGVQMLSQLATHYRMHCAIADCITHAYDKPLTHALARQEMQPGSVILSGHRLIWLHSDGNTEGKTHPQEVTRVIQLIRVLLKTRKPDEIGIITPWRAQVAAIRHALHEAGLPEILADTIDRFQGTEKEVVIFSVAVGDEQLLDGATSVMHERPDVDRKLLVALSRAKEQVILLAHPPSLVPHAAWRRSLDHFKIVDFDELIGNP